MGELQLIVEGHPRPYSIGTANNRIFYNTLCRQWQKEVIAQVVEQLPDDWEPISEQCEADYHFYLPRPKNHWNSKGELKDWAPLTHHVPPDASKMVRITEDGLTHANVWDDDALCAPVIGRKSWTARPGNEGGAVVVVRW